MKRLLIIFIAVFYCTSILAQPSGSSDPKKKTVYGIVQEQQAKMPVVYATVSIKDQSMKLIAAGITDEKGAFKFNDIPPGKLTIEFTMMGYLIITKPLLITAAMDHINTGTTFLNADSRLLKEISITSDQPAITLKLDKKVFETGKDILSQTGSAVELLNGVPAVSVGPSGTVSLRGSSNVLVLINGRRSGLTQGNALEQIPADQVERVEVITNPSSRYDAAGSSGIINIILKKNKKGGFNGQLRLVGGIPNETRITPSLSYKSDKLNVFSTFGIRLSDYVGLYTTNQSVSNNGAITFLNQQQDENRHDDAKLLYVGADYQLNDQQTVTVAFLKNSTHDHDKTALNYKYMNTGNAADSSLLRNGESWERRSYNQLEFNYTRKFKQPGKKHTIDIQYDFWNSDKDWNLGTKKLLPVIEILPAIRTSSIGTSKDFMAQTDFTQPLDSNTTLEFGLKAENRRVTSEFKAEQQMAGDWSIIDNINNQLNYNELIGGGYAQLGSKIGKLAYQLGLRTELTRVRVEDRAGTYNNNKNYVRLFPTLSLTYQLAKGGAIQGSYSKRINRPSLNLLYPFNELTDYNAMFIGNPELNPSYANVFEVGFLQRWNTFTLNPSVYYQNNKGTIQNYTFRNQDGIFITTPVNIDGEIRRGIELSAIYNPLQWLQLNTEFNAYSFKQTGWYQAHNFNYSGNVFTSRLSTQVKFKNKLSLQCRYNFTGAQSNAQSYSAAMNYIDLGASKNLLKDKATLLLDITNLFNLHKYQTTTTGNDYILAQTSIPNAARYRLTFVYRLNLKENQSVRQAKSGNRN
ncbi:outer membrane beta-barrel family protein [Pedobacter cryoconitis]|uniref:Outer membrane receptor protein involved in Fe transport n=1 Tax=Pedobacter cryoconitis TaxID=188932 RepID=A0A327SI76_9SPHI|nr:outer membrane beta-barrel family protein [Pedobacter cryoconitis]RAJ28826.1 outer membrane receptor protein involved in Fe transport [Pedobacter cryoconitis]